jgi:hypothetical protein
MADRGPAPCGGGGAAGSERRDGAENLTILADQREAGAARQRAGDDLELDGFSYAHWMRASQPRATGHLDLGGPMCACADGVDTTGIRSD